MSLVNIVVTPDRAYVGVDSICTNTLTGKHMKGAKMLHLPVQNVLLASRGSTLAVLFEVFLAYGDPDQSALKGIDYDSILTSIESVFGNAVVKVMNSITLDRPYLFGHDRHQIMVIGWSKKASRMRAIVLEERPAAIQMTYVDDCIFAAPAEQSWGEAPVQAAPGATLTALAAWQSRHIKAQYPGIGFGGELLIAELSKNGLVLRRAGPIPD